MHWYAVNTKPRQEGLAEQNLQRLGVETLYPLLRQNKVIRRRRQSVLSPLFPRYLFARFNLEAHYRAVRYTRGVQEVVAFGAEPARVDEAVIESIQSRLHNGCLTVQSVSFLPGQAVRIHGGPLRGIEAVFEKELSDPQRVILLLNTLSYQARVVLEREYVVNL